MKYWRGYLAAGIFGVLTYVLLQMGQRFTVLVDAVYPYVTRTLQTILTSWSSGVEFCIWQVVLIFLAVAALAVLVLTVVMKWSPIRWLGWVLACASLLVTVHTAIFGLNQYAGPLTDDLRMEVDSYTTTEMVEAAEYYQKQANRLAEAVERDENGEMKTPSILELSQAAGEGFDYLVYEKALPVFAGSQEPVKELAWPGLFTSLGVTGANVSLTGEAAVNPEIPAVIRPFAVCREMAKRMCIAIAPDADLAAFLVGRFHSDPVFQYSAYFMAYQQTLQALEHMQESSSSLLAQELAEKENSLLKQDMEHFREFFHKNVNQEHKGLLQTVQDRYRNVDGKKELYTTSDLLVRWYVQEVILPTREVEEIPFNPFDETQVNLHPAAE